MADHTGIEWTDATWNPIVGCSIVSPGCTNCYAMKQAARLLDGSPKAPHYAGTTRKANGHAVWTGKVALAPEHILTQPLRWKRPRRIFVNSMGDLFHEGVPDEWIDKVFAVMALSPHHTFQILTKRSGRMRSYLKDCRMTLGRQHEIRLATVELAGGRDAPGVTEAWLRVSGSIEAQSWKPLPNVWLGVSAEDQKRAEERIPDLIETPAAIRFVSAEPLLGPLDLSEIDINGDGEMNALAMRSWAEIWADAFDPAVTGTTLEEAIESFEDWGGTYPPTDIRPRGLDWVIAGGESGPGARPMHPQWARDLRDQCAAAGVAFHFKQWGEWTPRGPEAWGYPLVDNVPQMRVTDTGDNGQSLAATGGSHSWMQRVGKHTAGRLLDGIEHNAFPKVPA
ncbi:hypothetical protein BA190_09985 [Labrys sp. WJW]|uniref:phage Gp37/Gp68 family protein n=1 Tax=Labrys sp. WJW TaxID=1737983 RepID=UPI00082F5BDF|nr:phage Gp37/Gp68 family protein [Labrys sp. WJW]OCC05223.1 hypothetical protein BA190_09985 [Labrys sp. WJW]